MTNVPLSGVCSADNIWPCVFGETITGQRLPGAFRNTSDSLFKTNKDLILMNHDVCTVGSYVIAQKTGTMGETFVARVDEIIQQQGTVADMSRQPDGVLLQPARVTREALNYHMPVIELSYSWVFVPYQVRLGLTMPSHKDVNLLIYRIYCVL